MIDRCNILITGGGMAGMALASRLARWDRKVWLIERDDCSPANASWLSFGAWDPADAVGDDAARLSWAGAKFLDEIPGALVPKGALHLFSPSRLKEAGQMWMRGIRAGSGVRQLEAAEVVERLPWVKTDDGHCAAALWIPAGAAGMIDMSQLYSHFRSRFYERGGRILLDEALVEADYGGGAWTVRTTKGSMRADVIVNCAGAWSDDVARKCHARRVGLHSTKRAALSLAAAGAAELPWRNSPYVAWHRDSSVAYCELLPNGRAVVSPAGEAAWSGGEVEADSWQIKEALDQFESATSLHLDETKGTSWAWVRSSVGDGRPIIGWARETPAFFWMTGFGRGGAECALSASAMAADMIRNRKDFSWIADQYGIQASWFAPDRLASAGVSA